MGRGRGSSTGPSSGLSGGQASGARPEGRPEENTYKRERIRPKALGPGGRAVGSLLADGPTPTGEVHTVELGADDRQAIQQLSEEVEKEPLPAEHRARVQRFFDNFLGEEE